MRTSTAKSNPNRSPRVLLASMSGSYGGMEVRMQQDAELLKSRGWHPVVSTPPFNERAAWEHKLAMAGIDIARFPYPYVLENWRTRQLQRLKAQLFTAPAILRSGFDLAHVFLSWTTYGLGMLWAISRAGIPAIVSVHNAFPFISFTTWHRRHLYQAFASTRRIVAVSESALQHFLEIFAGYLPAATVVQVIPNPVDTVRFKPRPEQRHAARKRLEIPDDACVIGSIGRLDKQKQPWKLINTLAELHKLGLPAYLVLVGQGDLQQSLSNQAAALGLTNHVVFTGYVDDVENLMPALDLHLLLSRNEGFGLVTAEAMAAGIPALGSDVPGTRDVLAGMPGGQLLQTVREADIARQLAELLGAPHRLTAMALAGPKSVQARFGRGLVEDETLRTYRDALQQ